MIKRIVLVLGVTIFSVLNVEGQDFSNLWQGHFSYNNITDVTKSETKIYAAAENAIFSYDVNTLELETINTVNGLSGGNISAIYYSENYSSLLIGYQTGLIEIYSEIDNDVFSVVDILNKQNIPPNDKVINHFYENEGLIYISTDYGISVYDIDRLEFGDTYFIGNGGSQIIVNQVTIYNGEIFAACNDNNGIKKASLSNPNLIDYQQWTTIIGGDYFTIDTFNGNVYSVRSNASLYELIGGQNPTIITNLPAVSRKTDITADKIMFSTSNAIYGYDINIQLVDTFQPNADFDTEFKDAVILGQDVYIGTQGFGVLRASLADNSTYQEIKPNGPIANNIFKLNAETGVVWATYGDYTNAFNSFPLRSRGMSYLRDEEWTSIPFDNLLSARNLCYISVNPFNPSQVFISSFKDGILEFNDFEPTILYDNTNSGLESLILPSNPNFVGIRVAGNVFDDSGKLWSITSRIDSPLKSYDPGTGNWESYSFTDLIFNGATDETGFGDILVDGNGTKWLAAYTNGLIAYNENNSGQRIKNIFGEEQNMPSDQVRSIALDNRNQLWIGTSFGLRVLFNTSNFFEEENIRVNEIVILEDGIPKELLQDQYVTDIKVDGSNNKWVGTLSSGIFYFSPDGQNTIYHFTTDNSPLPSNLITDISIDSNSGTVYIGTDRGLVSFSAGGSKPEETLSNAFTYPNPVRPEYDLLGYNDLNDITKGVKISGLTENVNVKITDIEGNLVAEAQSNVNLRSSSANYNFAIDGGTGIWNGRNLANSIVATGVYLIMISDLNSFETKVLKLLIVRGK